MVKIAVIHPNMVSAGGAESYCMLLLEYFQKKGSITFITDKKTDFKKLNETFDNNVDPEKIIVIRPLSCRIIGKIEPYIHMFANLELTFFSRYIKRHRYEYNLIISTKGEADLGKPGLQIMPHLPNRPPTTIHGHLYLWILKMLGRKKENIAENITLCPTNYVKEEYDKIYGWTKSYVISSPIRKCPITRDWNKRENGFVIIGRIDKDKKTDEAISIVEELTKTHNGIHLHIIGNGKGRYYKKIKAMAREQNHVHLDGFVDPDKYFETITSHKYAIHMRENEPSAVTIREAIDGGEIVFAHNSGGNGEILNDNEQLLFNNNEEAINKIVRVLSDETLQSKLQKELKKLKFNSREEYIKEFDRFIKETKLL